jgi:hypothetical protein
MKRCLAWGLVIAWNVNLLASAGEGGLSDAQFNAIHKELTATTEPWQGIPWHVSLLEARGQAAREKKPIYLLCRAGHPLGCV